MLVSLSFTPVLEVKRLKEVETLRFYFIFFKIIEIFFLFISVLNIRIVRIMKGGVMHSENNQETGSFIWFRYRVHSQCCSNLSRGFQSHWTIFLSLAFHWRISSPGGLDCISQLHDCMQNLVQKKTTRGLKKMHCKNKQVCLLSWLFSSFVTVPKQFFFSVSGIISSCTEAQQTCGTFWIRHNLFQLVSCCDLLHWAKCSGVFDYLFSMFCLSRWFALFY